MQQFNRLNTILGWVVFAIALTTYTLTMEPTGSLWDCGEFLSGAAKLQVVHPPGAPLFLMVGRLFMLLAGGDMTHAAMMVNFMSALCTALCSLFFFWSSTILIRRAVSEEGEELTTDMSVAILGSSFVAAMAATFLDSMWFSAVEGEVYALSVFFMTVNVWAALKWFEDRGPKADRWLLFIALSTGLSIGVHLLSLLVFPMIGLIFYFKNFKASWKGIFISFTASVISIFAIQKFIIYGIPGVFCSLELLLVNSFGLPFNSGVLLGFILLIIFFTYILRKSISNRNFLRWNEASFKISLNTVILCIILVVIGFSSYIMVPIRANAQTALNMNAPGDMMSLNSYLNREQYGDRPLIKGPDYTASQYDIEEVVKKGDTYKRNEVTGKYEDVGDKMDYKFKASANMIFPRLGFWMEERYKQAFRGWLNPSFAVADRGNENSIEKFFPESGYQAAEQYAQELNSKTQPGRYFVKDNISFKDNIRFFFQYQWGFMYMRYLMWNFAGRTEDPQGIYANDEGRWQSGIPFVDNLVGDAWGNPKKNQEGKPAVLTSNRANNKFYLIPFLLCIIGLVWHYRRNPFSFSIVFVLWFVSGFMQVVFHNQPPIEPRERDYVYAPSFWAFTFWLGFGVYTLYEFFKKNKIAGMGAAGMAILLGLAAPALMGSQGWDDHDRSDRYTTVAFAKNMLMSCDQNAVLFTYGDNDTYPLWYAQEVEGYRTDVRVVNLSLLGVDWYVNQLRYTVNKNTALKLTLSQDKLNGNRRDMLRHSAQGYEKERIELGKMLQFMGSEDKSDKVMVNQESENFIPSMLSFITIDKEKTAKNNIISAADLATLPERMEFNIPSSLQKNDLVTLDIIANNMFDRPICFAISCSPSAFVGFDNYMQMDGLVYRVVPAFNPNGMNSPKVYTEKAIPRLMAFEWGNINRGLYNIKTGFVSCANGLIQQGKKAEAIKLIDYLYSKMPRYNVPADRYEMPMPQMYYMAGETAKAKVRVEEISKNALDILKWSSSAENKKYQTMDVSENFQILYQLSQICGQFGDTTMAKKLNSDLQTMQARMQ
jgi:hypothetical protein